MMFWASDSRVPWYNVTGPFVHGLLSIGPITCSTPISFQTPFPAPPSTVYERGDRGLRFIILISPSNFLASSIVIDPLLQFLSSIWSRSNDSLWLRPLKTFQGDGGFPASS